MGQVAEADPGEPELAQVPAGTSVDGVAVADAGGAGVPGLAPQFAGGGLPDLLRGVGAAEDALEFGAAGRVAGDGRSRAGGGAPGPD